MLLTRFWAVLTGLAIGGLLFVLYVAASAFDRTADHTTDLALQSDSQVVSWFMRDDARQQSAQLILFALDPEVKKQLHASSQDEARVPAKAREAAAKALTAIQTELGEERFDVVFAIDQLGRVVAMVGYEQPDATADMDLGGYTVVADALRGYSRDDTLVLDSTYRVVSRPVEYVAGEAPAGAIVGGRFLNDKFAMELSRRTGAAVAFFTDGRRIAAGAPEGFNKAQLDQIVSDLDALDADEEYRAKGRSSVRMIGDRLKVVYGRLPGETWELGAGYAVARNTLLAGGPFGFLNVADDKDKASAPLPIVGGLALGVALIGLVLTFLEHSMPLSSFRKEAKRLSNGEAEQLRPSRFRGALRRIAAELNEGIDIAASKGGTSRKAANLNEVLGDLPAEPQMSAFSFPGSGTQPGIVDTVDSDSGAESRRSKDAPSRPLPAAPPGRGGAAPSPRLPSAPGSGPSRPHPPAPALAEEATAVGLGPEDSMSDGPIGEVPAGWREVFDAFVAAKKECGESLEGFTFERFQKTLRKNHDALVARHGAKDVKFSVYIKNGRAALKASPVK